MRVYHSLTRKRGRDMQEIEVKECGPYKGPKVQLENHTYDISKCQMWVVGMKMTRKEIHEKKTGQNNKRDQREENKKWLGQGGVLRRTLVA
jgi:hypothetical protein